MKRTLIISLLMFIAATRAGSQWLPVWSGQTGTTVVENFRDGDTLDSKFAVMHYGLNSFGVRKRSVLTYNALRTIEVADHYKLYVYAKLPAAADLSITIVFADSTNWAVLYSTNAVPKDNQDPDTPIDTAIVIDVPAGSVFHYGRPFSRFALIRDYRDLARASVAPFYIDALFLESCSDSVVTRDTIDTTPKDTLLSVRPSGKGFSRSISPARPVDILGRLADTLHTRWWMQQDSNGYWKIRIRK